MITRQQACDLFKYDFKLVDKEGNEWCISGIENVVDATIIKLSIESTSTWINIKQIGLTYFILAYHHSCLTKQINGVIPIVEICKDRYKKIYYAEDYDENELNDMELCILSIFKCPDSITVPVSNKLYSLRFLPHGIEESNVKYIND